MFHRGKKHPTEGDWGILCCIRTAVQLAPSACSGGRRRCRPDMTRLCCAAVMLHALRHRCVSFCFTSRGHHCRVIAVGWCNAQDSFKLMSNLWRNNRPCYLWLDSNYVRVIGSCMSSFRFAFWKQSILLLHLFYLYVVWLSAAVCLCNSKWPAVGLHTVWLGVNTPAGHRSGCRADSVTDELLPSLDASRRRQVIVR